MEFYYSWKKRTFKKAIYVERKLLKESVGHQDQYSTTFGGFNVIKYSKKKTEIKRILISKKKKKFFY